MFRQLKGMCALSKIVALGCSVRGWQQCMQDVVRETHSLMEKFIVHGVTQVIKRRQIGRAVSVAMGAVNYGIDALAVTRLEETAPYAGGIRQPCDDGGSIHVLQSDIGETASS